MSTRKNIISRLPLSQLLILAICRFAEPVVLTSVYPYIPEMFESFGLSKSQLGKWAGIASAAFSLSQASTAILWGYFSDHYGRKPAVLLGLSCTVICSLIWGFSSNLTMAIIARAFQGAFNGNVGTTRTIVAEMVTDKELQPTAFSVLPMVWAFGSTIGPSFGGFFAKPAEHMPSIFGNSSFFKRFPFALPNIVASLLFVIGITTAIFFLRETHHDLKHRIDYGILMGKRIKHSLRLLGYGFWSKVSKSSKQVTENDLNETSPLLSSSLTSSDSTQPPPSNRNKSSDGQNSGVSQVFTFQSTLNLINYTFLSCHIVTYDQLLPIFMHNEPLKSHISLENLSLRFSGGFGLDSSRIGSIFTLQAILMCIGQFFIYPPLAKRFGVLKCLRTCVIIFPIAYFITPFTALVPSGIYQQIMLGIIMMGKNLGFIISFPSAIILMTNSARCVAILGTLNGLAVTVSAFGRAIGPGICGPVLTWGIKNNFIIAPWWLLSFISLMGIIPVWWIEEGQGFSSSDTKASSVEVGEECEEDLR